MKNRENFVIILILGALCTISPFSIDMYLPGFPAMAKDLGVDISQIQLSLTSYLVGIAIGQLFYGPLLDKYGRKKPLIIGMLIYIVSSIFCAYASSVDSLILMRFLQAVGGCVGMVAAQALVRDIFPINKTAQVLALLTLVIAVSPMIAPTVGGYMSAHFHWHAIFIVLAAITAVILVAAIFLLPNGAAPESNLSLRPMKVISNYRSVLDNRQFLTYMLAGGIAGAAPFAYIAGSANVFMNIYQVSEQTYGLIFGVLAFAMIGSTQLNHYLLRKFTSKQIIQFSLWYQTITGLVLVAGLWLNLFNVYGLVFTMFIFLTAHGLNQPNAAALSLAPFAKSAGSASALLGSMRMAMGGVVSATVSFIHNGTALPMVSIMALCALGGLLTIMVDKRIPHNKRVPSNSLNKKIAIST
ncbi:Bcr/CflA family multidrug efflux MFS transporter [Belliella sp. DSM 111904]|uniref:Bcr/CflA family multidrug efflux MFS transporter n=1 Tax=Belliella filtrata TaxID=2923435 RepID=A0ABS9UYV5_9BACT|nr:Bcr/CflA family multidrug efflux MFS transporter [Belliella filtrata]MCH7409134.1 Bcr/CflA family multidrug efflux MFS transporter [Belliella filtrata]